MKNKLKKLGIVTGVALGIAMVLFMASTKAKKAEFETMYTECVGMLLGVDSQTLDRFNANGWPADFKEKYDKKRKELENSLYSDWSKSPSTLVSEYHANVNKEFNKYIKKMITGTRDFENKKDTDPNSRAPERKPDGSPGDCTADNYSTYCVAYNIYSSPKYGYKALRDILTCRKVEIYDSQVESEKPQYQDAAALAVGAKITGIDTQLDKAKKALDQTLSAYDQLKTAWALHKKYMAVYEKLLQYRDYISEIRRSVEVFPAKFIDASTTKCI